MLTQGAKWLFEMSWRRRQEAAMKDREGYNQSGFIERLSDHDPDVCLAVLERLSEEAVVENFCPVPSDNILYMYGLDDEDLDAAILDVIKKCGRVVPRPEQSLKMRPVETVEDFVCFVQELPEDKGTFDQPDD